MSSFETFVQHKISDRMVYNMFIFGRKNFWRPIASSDLKFTSTKILRKWPYLFSLLLIFMRFFYNETVIHNWVFDVIFEVIIALADISSQDISSPDISSQPFGHMDIWSHGHLVTRTIGHKDIWSQNISSHGYSVTWTFRHRTYRHRTFRHTDIPSHGHFVTGHFVTGHFVTRTFRHRKFRHRTFRHRTFRHRTFRHRTYIVTGHISSQDISSHGHFVTGHIVIGYFVTQTFLFS
jgi:hypothetical protein